jgi:hypothetical protein
MAELWKVWLDRKTGIAMFVMTLCLRAVCSV